MRKGTGLPKRNLMPYRYYVFENSGEIFGTNNLDTVYTFVDELDDSWQAVDAKTGEYLWDRERDKEGKAKVFELMK